MPDYCARPIPHLKGLHRVLALRKQHAGLYDGLFVRDAGKFLSGYNMAASQEIAPHVLLPIWSPGGGARGTVAPLPPLVTLRNILRGKHGTAKAAWLEQRGPPARPQRSQSIRTTVEGKSPSEREPFRMARPEPVRRECLSYNPRAMNDLAHRSLNRIDCEQVAGRATIQLHLVDGGVRKRDCGEALRERRIEQRIAGGSGDAAPDTAGNLRSLARSRGLGDVKRGSAMPRRLTVRITNKPTGKLRTTRTLGRPEDVLGSGTDHAAARRSNSGRGLP